MRSRIRDLFRAHRVEAWGGVFHVPDVTRYPALFSWDSAYHALCLRHLDPSAAVAELLALYSANTLENGLLSHQRQVPGSEENRNGVIEMFGPMFDGDRTPFVDPPAAAYAVAQLSGQLGREVDDLLDAAVAHLDALTRHRTLPGSPLPVVIHPFETGTEGSEVTDALFPAAGWREAVPRLRRLTESAAAAGFDPASALASGHGFVVEDPGFCGWYLLALEAVAAAGRRRGERHAVDAARLEQTADDVARAMVERHWWAEGRLFGGWDCVGRRPLRGVSATGVIAAASGRMVSGGYSEVVRSAHLGPGGPMWGPYGLAAGRADPAGGVARFVQWRGNAVWGATAYWAHLALRAGGRAAEAREVRLRMEELVEREGFRELYDVFTGAAGGAGEESGFTWPALVLEMEAGE